MIYALDLAIVVDVFDFLSIKRSNSANSALEKLLLNLFFGPYIA
jgi:hypothetical protein